MTLAAKTLARTLAIDFRRVQFTPDLLPADLIGTIAKQAEKQNYQVFMVTPDKDFGQLVDEKIFLYKPSKGGEAAEVWGIKEVCERWNIKRVDQVVDMLGLMGDAVDNIPGIPGIGEKTAMKLVQQFGSLEGVIDGVEQLGRYIERLHLDSSLGAVRGVFAAKKATATASRWKRRRASGSVHSTPRSRYQSAPCAGESRASAASRSRASPESSAARAACAAEGPRSASRVMSSPPQLAHQRGPHRISHVRLLAAQVRGHPEEEHPPAGDREAAQEGRAAHLGLALLRHQAPLAQAGQRVLADMRGQVVQARQQRRHRLGVALGQGQRPRRALAQALVLWALLQGFEQGLGQGLRWGMGVR